MPLDREAVRRDPSVGGRWRARVQRRQAELLESGDVATNRGFANQVLRFNAQMIEDVQWLAGYEAGLADAAAKRAAEPMNGPGATPLPKDGWSTSVMQQDAYRLGLADGETLRGRPSQ